MGQGEKQKENRIQKIVEEYCKLHNNHINKGVSALVKSGICLLKSNGEIKEVISRIEKRGITKIRIYLKDLGEDMTLFFNYVAESNVSPNEINVEEICRKVYKK